MWQETKNDLCTTLGCGQSRSGPQHQEHEFGGRPFPNQAEMNAAPAEILTAACERP